MDITYTYTNGSFCIHGDTTTVKEKLLFLKARWIPIKKCWLLPEKVSFVEILSVFGNIKQYSEKYLERSDTYQFREEIKKRGGVFDQEKKKWKVPKNFDESFMD